MIRAKKVLCFAVYFLICFGDVSFAKQSYGTLHVIEMKSVYDGDTFRANISNVHPLIGHNVGIRVNGIDTPEMKDSRPHIRKLAKQARTVAYDLLYRAEYVELRNVQRGKYFRIVADVYCDGVSLGNVLIKKGLAKPYFGGKKSKWE